MNLRAAVVLLVLSVTGCSADEAVDAVGTVARSATVCDGADEQATCVEVLDAERVEELQAAFLSGRRSDEQCPGLDQQVYRLVLTVDGGPRTVDVPAACGPTLTSPSYEVTDDERGLVEALLDGR